MDAPYIHLLFDLGGTLMHPRRAWDEILPRADLALADALRSRHIELDTKVFRAQLHQYYEQRDQNCEETTYHFVLRELLEKLGYINVAESTLRSALDALYAVTQENWELEDDTAAALRTLNAHRYHAGILSNAGDDKDVQELIEKFGIRPHLDFTLTSAACYYRKPHPRAFEIALAQWSITPKEAVMIGDSLAADIEGAKQLGMKTIWITRRAKFSPEEKARIEPDYEITSLNEILPILKSLNAR